MHAGRRHHMAMPDRPEPAELLAHIEDRAGHVEGPAYGEEQEGDPGRAIIGLKAITTSQLRAT